MVNAMLRLVLLLMFCLSAQTSWAGAWLREHGAGFLALSVLQADTGGTDLAAYAEYGLRPKLTIGVKLDTQMVQGQFSDGAAFVFLKRPIPTGERAFKLSYHVGVGSTLGGDAQPQLMTGLSYGRGFVVWNRDGWVALDASMHISPDGRDDATKLDATVGLTLTNEVRMMMQVFFSETATDDSITLAPSLIWRPRRDRPSLQIGLEAKEDTVALRLGLWSEF